MKRKTQLILIMILTILIVGACSNNNDDDGGEDQATDDPVVDNVEQMGELEPALDNIPDVVAEVNGQVINGEEFEMTYLSQFQQVALEAQMQGQTLNQEQMKQELVENMISQELLIQEADQRGFSVTDEAIGRLLNELVVMNELESEAALIEIYEQQGMSEELLKEQLALQIKLDALISEETQDIEVTEDQVIDFYAELVSVYEEMETEEELPPMEEIRLDLEGQIRSQEENTIITELIENLRANADITKNL